MYVAPMGCDEGWKYLRYNNICVVYKLYLAYYCYENYTVSKTHIVAPLSLRIIVYRQVVFRVHLRVYTYDWISREPAKHVRFA